MAVLPTLQLLHSLLPFFSSSPLFHKVRGLKPKILALKSNSITKVLAASLNNDFLINGMRFVVLGKRLCDMYKNM